MRGLELALVCCLGLFGFCGLALRIYEAVTR